MLNTHCAVRQRLSVDRLNLNWSGRMIGVFGFTLFGLVSISFSSEQSFVLKEIFNETDGVLAGFGDFNADKRVDVFVISKQGQNVDVWLSNGDGRFYKDTVIQTNPDSFGTSSFIAGLMLTDFDGDGFLEILCIINSLEGTKLVIYWGSAEGLVQHSQLDVQITDEPILFEFNGDGLPDLLVEETGGNQSVFLSSHNQTFEKVTFPSTGHLANPHSSAFVNVTFSANIDLVMTMKNGEYHIFTDNDYSKFASYEINNKLEVGQSSFGDLNQDGLIDHLVPNGKEIKVYFNKTWHTLFELPPPLKFDSTNSITTKQNVIFKIPPTLIVGDYDSDGYLDVLTVVKKDDHHIPLLLRNVPCSSDKVCSLYGRMLEAQELPEVHGDVHLAAFYDYLEDGSLDILLTSVAQNDNTQIRLLLLKNIIAADTCFLKITVTSGLLEKFPLSDKKPYGVNVPGISVFCETIKTNGEALKSSATQLTQSAHFSLQMPFVLFGLGQTPNFIDTINITLPHRHAQKERSRIWTQIVPNSQLIVNPYKLDNPLMWTMQLFVMPSKQIYTTAAVLGSTCVGLAFIVAGLLWKEAKEDKAEKKQESHRFNFDAM